MRGSRGVMGCLIRIRMFEGEVIEGGMGCLEGSRGG